MYGMSDGHGRRSGPSDPPRDDNEDARQRQDVEMETMMVYRIDEDSDNNNDGNGGDDEPNQSSVQDFDDGEGEGAGQRHHHDDDDIDDDDDDDDDDVDGNDDDATMAGDAAGGTDPSAGGGDGAAEADGGATREGEEEGASAAGANGGVVVIRAVSSLDRLRHLREMGREALCWQLSSAKPGNGVEQIRENNLDTYWQSDGTTQPHWIQVTFGRRVAMSHVCLYLDYAQDESYTPRRLQVEVGMTDQDLGPAIHPPLTQIELQEPNGWCIIPLSSPPDPLDDLCSPTSHGVVRAHLIRISILSMHQNGRDTHVRQVQIFGPRLSDSATPNPQESDYPTRAPFRPATFRTIEASMFSSIR